MTNFLLLGLNDKGFVLTNVFTFIVLPTRYVQEDGANSIPILFGLTECGGWTLVGITGLDQINVYRIDDRIVFVTTQFPHTVIFHIVRHDVCRLLRRSRHVAHCGLYLLHVRRHDPTWNIYDQTFPVTTINILDAELGHAVNITRHGDH
jgi:hypothetical protein